MACLRGQKLEKPQNFMRQLFCNGQSKGIFCRGKLEVISRCIKRGGRGEHRLDMGTPEFKLQYIEGDRGSVRAQYSFCFSQVPEIKQSHRSEVWLVSKGGWCLVVCYKKNWFSSFHTHIP